MSTKNKIPKFNDNTPLGEIKKYCLENNKIFEINEKGYLFFDLIPNLEKEEDITKLKSSSNMIQVHVKNQGKRKFSDFGIAPKKQSKKEINHSKLINALVDLNKIIETGFYKNSWGEKFPYKKLSNGTLIVYKPDNKTIRFTIDFNGIKSDKGIKQENKLNTLPVYNTKKKKSKNKKSTHNFKETIYLDPKE